MEKRLEMDEEVSPCVEDSIPPGMASKPLWARGIDILGYGLSSFCHAILPLENVIDNNRKSRIIVAKFGEYGRNKILQVILWPTSFFALCTFLLFVLQTKPPV